VSPNYSRVTNDLFDHTDAGTIYDKTQLLNGGLSGQVGLSKSLAVVPGDTIVAEVYAKYFGTEGGPGNLTGFAAARTGTLGSVQRLPTVGISRRPATYGSLGAIERLGGGRGADSYSFWQELQKFVQLFVREVVPV
jgi:hypothetical protein